MVFHIHFQGKGTLKQKRKLRNLTQQTALAGRVVDAFSSTPFRTGKTVFDVDMSDEDKELERIFDKVKRIVLIFVDPIANLISIGRRETKTSRKPPQKPTKIKRKVLI
jgi:hypothetical protein